MSCLSQNYYRAANPCAIHVLKDLVQDKRPDLIFLIETIYGAGKIYEIKTAIGYDKVIMVERRGHSRGLALFWNNNVGVTLLNQYDHHIDGEVKLKLENPYRLIGFYGYADRG